MFGSSLVGLLQAFPKSILGVMLFISGIELASAARAVNNGIYDEKKQKENWTIMLITMGAIIAYSNIGIGFVAGLVVALLLPVQRLGVREWYVSFIQGIRDIPSKWRHPDAFVYKHETVVDKAHYGDSEDSERQPLLDCNNNNLSKPGGKATIVASGGSSSSSSPLLTSKN